MTHPVQVKEMWRESGDFLQSIENGLETVIDGDGMSSGAEQTALPPIPQNRVVMPAAANQRNVAGADAVLIGVDADRAALVDQAVARGERDPTFRFRQAEESNDFGRVFRDAFLIWRRHGS